MPLFRPPLHKGLRAVGAPLPTACATPKPLLDGTTGLDKHFDGVGQSDEARKRAPRAKYAPMCADTGELAGAARENLLRAQCKPSSGGIP